MTISVAKPISFRSPADLTAWLSRYGGEPGKQAKQDLGALRGLVAETEFRLSGLFVMDDAHAILGIAWEPLLAVPPGRLPEVMAMALHEAGQDPELVYRVERLSPLEAYVVLHWVRTWWQGRKADDPDDYRTRKLFRVKD